MNIQYTLNITYKWILCFIAVCLLFFAGSSLSWGAAYFVSPTGSDDNSGIAEQQAWATFKYSLTHLNPGDSLTLLDGIYKQTLDVTITGTAAAPIIIKAKNDGQVIIDGEGVRVPAVFGRWETSDNGYIVVEGIIFYNSYGSVVTIYSHHNTFKRCSAYHGKVSGNDHAWNLAKATHTLLEDCIAAATERHLFISWTDDGKDTYNTFRRCFAVGTIPGQPSTASSSEFNIYGGSHDLVENAIGWGGTRSASISVHSQSGADYANHDNRILGGIFLRSDEAGVSINHAGGEAPRNNIIENSLIYGNRLGFNIGESGRTENTVLNHCTIINNELWGTRIKDPLTTVKNTILNTNGSGYNTTHHKGAFSYINNYGNENNNDILSDWANSFSAEPFMGGNMLSIADNSPSKGAGESGTDIGANIQYRYKDGVLTNEPLWPWPMQQRIRDELGIDVMGELKTLFNLAYTEPDPGSGTGPPVDTRDWEQVMDLAESLYPDLLPTQNRQDTETPLYKVRFYPESNSYLGFNLEDGRFYAYNTTLWDENVQAFGLLNEYLPGIRIQDGQRVMNWAESLRPDLLPVQNRQILEFPPYQVRYYSESNFYLGYNPEDERFYAYNTTLWGENVQALGLLSEYLPAVPDWQRVMSWAEFSSLELLSENNLLSTNNRQNLDIPPYHVRYYPDSDTYLGYISEDEHFYAYNATIWGGDVQIFGVLSEYLPAVQEAGF
ncbi:MAG: hypothetical protein GY862_15485 [Gammaproteobacteria bacterium]|nr:hypothetical protein [Gammaproteobacteria bacterium]